MTEKEQILQGIIEFYEDTLPVYDKIEEVVIFRDVERRNVSVCVYRIQTEGH